MSTYIYNGGVIQPTYSADGNKITGLVNPDGTTTPIGGEQVWRGIGQAMSLAVQGFSGGTNVWSSTNRTRHYSNVRFRRVRAVLQCFWMTGSPIADTLFAEDYNFQVGFELGYTNATTGLQPRKAFTFSGSPIAQYLVASPPANGYILSDVLDLGRYVEANEFFGLWTTIEAAARTGSNKIPYTRNGSNFFQRYIGSIQAANTSQIDANSAITATSITATSSSQTGASTYFSPCMLLVETDSGEPFVFVIGDSISYGVGEGVAGSGNNGDSVGSPLGNSGWAERAVYELLGYNGVNISKGSDGFFNLKTASNWQYRRELLKLANPTHVISSNIHNDISTTLVLNGRANSTAYAQYDVVSQNNHAWLCLKAGTSAASAFANTTGIVYDGTCVWQEVQDFATYTGTARSGVQALGYAANVHNQIAAVTNAPIICMLPTPDASSTDSWATDTNQTPATNWGNALTRRGYLYSMFASLPYYLKASAYVDPNTALEFGGPNTTSKWVVNGQARYATNDGTHDNSTGYALHATTLTPSKFV